MCMMQMSPLLRTLGNSDLGLTSIGFGTWALGGSGWKYSVGSSDDDESIAAIHCALDLGVNWIDTAGIYGLGHSERIIARAVRTASKKPFIFTKCSARWRRDGSLYNTLKAGSVVEEMEGSLRRLGVEAIDLCQVHWPQPENEIEEGWEALTRLREQGKIRWIGVSNFSVSQMKRIQKIAPITSLQPHYSMLNRKVETEILPFARASGIGVINYSPMASGLLTGNMSADAAAALPSDDYRRKMNVFQEPRLGRNLRLVELLREIGEGHGVSPGVVAVAWTLHNPAITAAILGWRSVKEVLETAPALYFRLDQNEYEQIGRFLKSFGWNLGLMHARLASRSKLAKA